MQIIFLKLPTGTDEANTVSPITRSVSFTVNDGENGLNQATVKIDGDNLIKTTGSAGGFNVDLSDGEHTIEASKEGYITKTETITVDKNHTEITISLTAE